MATVQRSFAWNPLYASISGCQDACLSIQKKSGQTIVAATRRRAPPLNCACHWLFFFLNPCRIALLESTCTQGVCAARSFGRALSGCPIWGAAPVVKGCSNWVAPLVLGSGASIPGVDSACFERPFFVAFSANRAFVWVHIAASRCQAVHGPALWFQIHVLLFFWILRLWRDIKRY